jgi:hypothetical protein
MGIHSYEEAQDWLKRGRHPESHRRLAPNTKLLRANLAPNVPVLVVRLYATDIITYTPNGAVRLQAGTWQTQTTLRRMGEFGPRMSISLRRGVWILSWQGKSYIFRDCWLPANRRRSPVDTDGARLQTLAHYLQEQQERKEASKVVAKALKLLSRYRLADRSVLDSAIQPLVTAIRSQLHVEAAQAEAVCLNRLQADYTVRMRELINANQQREEALHVALREAQQRHADLQQREEALHVALREAQQRHADLVAQSAITYDMTKYGVGAKQPRAIRMEGCDDPGQPHGGIHTPPGGLRRTDNGAATGGGPDTLASANPVPCTMAGCNMLEDAGP